MTINHIWNTDLQIIYCKLLIVFWHTLDGLFVKFYLILVLWYGFENLDQSTTEFIKPLFDNELSTMQKLALGMTWTIVKRLNTLFIIFPSYFLNCPACYFYIPNEEIVRFVQHEFIQQVIAVVKQAFHHFKNVV